GQPAEPEPPDGGPASAAAAKALVDKAVRAKAGDAARLARLRHQTFTLTGKIFLPDNRAEDAECKVTLRLPGFGRWSVEKSQGGTKLAMIFGVQEDVGWLAQAGATADMDPARLEDLHGDLLLFWVTSLVPLTEPN